MNRTIVIGDVHGCLDELNDLLREVGASKDDRLISVGDLICKGPDSRGVLDWAMAAKNLEVVVGNHELRFLEHWRLGLLPDDKPYDWETYRQLADGFEDYMRYIESWRLAIDEKDLLVVHAGFDPKWPVEAQSARTLTSLRRLGHAEAPWYELYKDRRLAVFGHWAKPEPVVRANAIGLDTGCVYGGMLSALILPERRVVSVQSRRAYMRKEKWSVPVHLAALR